MKGELIESPRSIPHPSADCPNGAPYGSPLQAKRERPACKGERTLPRAEAQSRPEPGMTFEVCIMRGELHFGSIWLIY